MTEVKSVVRVKMKIGEVQFDIECSVNELRSVVDKVLAAVAESGIVGNATAGGGERKGSVGFGARANTCKGVIIGLWREGWFRIGRSLGEVHGEMGRGGFHYDRTAVAHALMDLVREGVLTREGRPRRYRYLQKRPPTAKTKKKEE